MRAKKTSNPLQGKPDRGQSTAKARRSNPYREKPARPMSTSSRKGAMFL